MKTEGILTITSSNITKASFKQLSETLLTYLNVVFLKEHPRAYVDPFDVIDGHNRWGVTRRVKYENVGDSFTESIKKALDAVTLKGMMDFDWMINYEYKDENGIQHFAMIVKKDCGISFEES